VAGNKAGFGVRGHNTNMEPNEAYPSLMAYIHDRNSLSDSRDWCDRLWADEAQARDGAYGDVAIELKRAQSDYAEYAKRRGRSPYPYNRDMGEFLGLQINPRNNEPGHGYYMACGVADNYRLGAIKREAERLIAEGKPLIVVAARSKRDGKPIRFRRYIGPRQIKLEGSVVLVDNGKTKSTLPC
jgi:hypothetical protein